jgi:MFS family permease
LGSALGALFGGPMMAIGRRRCIILTNILVIAGSLICLVDDFYIFLIGRVLFGASAGLFSLFCPKFLAETSPTEYKGPIGGLSQLCITFGILVPFSIGIFFPDPSTYSDTTNKIFVIALISAIPICLSILQVFLLVTIFRYDTPVFLKLKGDGVGLNELMSKIYHPYVV